MKLESENKTDIILDEIVEKCDQWVELFKQIHDILKTLSLTEKYQNKKIGMRVYFGEFFQNSSGICSGKTIHITMNYGGKTFHEGIKIAVSDDNIETYCYLVARVIDYYLEKNCAQMEIELEPYGWYLASNIQSPEMNDTMIASFNILREYKRTAKVVEDLICYHNLGLPINQIIAEQKQAMINQPMLDTFDQAIEGGARQLEALVQTVQTKDPFGDHTNKTKIMKNKSQ